VISASISPGPNAGRARPCRAGSNGLELLESVGAPADREEIDEIRDHGMVVVFGNEMREKSADVDETPPRLRRGGLGQILVLAAEDTATSA
jgi:hypothetical protein